MRPVARGRYPRGRQAERSRYAYQQSSVISRQSKFPVASGFGFASSQFLVLLCQIVKTQHTTHRSENRVGNVEKSAFGLCPLAPRWSVTTALVRLQCIFALAIGFVPRCLYGFRRAAFCAGQSESDNVVLIRSSQRSRQSSADCRLLLVMRAKRSRVEWVFGSPTTLVWPPYPRTISRSGTDSAV